MEINQLFSLDGKKALVGGSTSGLGKAIAMSLATAGAKITLLARNEVKLRETLGELQGSGHDYIIADFSEPDLLKQTIKSYLATNNGFDILINNTGGPAPGPIFTAEPEEFLNAYKMHLICNQILTKLLVPHMIENSWGRIINIISTSVRQPIPNLGVSNTTRGAVGNWAKTLANELGKHNITVNNILPGPVRTPRLVQILNKRSENNNTTFEVEEDKMAKSVPMGRVGEPEEIGAAGLFLASNAASYINGTNLIVDGGRTKSY